MNVNLYIIDENLLTRIAQRQLFSKSESFKVIGEFSNIKTCLKKIKTQIPDVVLMDIEYSDTNGFEAIKAIKRICPKIKIVAVSTIKDEKNILKAFACGVSGYVLKENIAISLKNAIISILGGGFWMNNEIANLTFSTFPKNKTEKTEISGEKNIFKENLTSREMQVLKLMIDGKTNSQIAREIIVSTNTAKAHVGNILNKLSVKDRVQAVVKAVRANIF